MIKHILIAVFFIAPLIGMSQNFNNGLKGPKAKNAKVWKQDPSQFNTLVAHSHEAKLKGPKAKNTSPQEAIKETPEVKRKDITYGRERLQGPRFKNRKIWRE